MTEDMGVDVNAAATVGLIGALLLAFISGISNDTTWTNRVRYVTFECRNDSVGGLADDGLPDKAVFTPFQM
jgi:hypothetical protein